jgi:hypothetical protein
VIVVAVALALGAVALTVTGFGFVVLAWLLEKMRIGDHRGYFR